MKEDQKLNIINDITFKKIKNWKAEKLKIGFTNGCFDLLHAGHISLLNQAKNACDRLVVGLNSDASVSRLKGPSRPIQNDISRATILLALRDVDAVYIFNEDTPLSLIELIKPNTLVKGADYKIENVVGRNFVENLGGKVVLADLASGQSTTNLITRMQLGYDK